MSPTGEATHRVRTETRDLFVFRDDAAAAQLLTAVTEMVQNAVSAHIAASDEQPIEVTFVADPPSCRVADTGPGFGWETVTESTPDPTSPSGRGLLIATAFVPGLTLTSGPDGTTVELPFEGATSRRRDPEP